jgi:hypothetical protein
MAADRRSARGAIRLTPLDAAPEPRNLRLLKKEIAARWGTVPLIDILKEAVLRTGCLNAATSAATRGDLDPGMLAQRLLLAVYAYGTNTGIRAVAAGEHGHSEDDIRYVRRRYLSPTPPSPPGTKPCCRRPCSAAPSSGSGWPAPAERYGSSRPACLAPIMC